MPPDSSSERAKRSRNVLGRVKKVGKPEDQETGRLTGPQSSQPQVYESEEVYKWESIKPRQWGRSIG